MPQIQALYVTGFFKKCYRWQLKSFIILGITVDTPADVLFIFVHPTRRKVHVH